MTDAPLLTGGSRRSEAVVSAAQPAPRTPALVMPRPHYREQCIADHDHDRLVSRTPIVGKWARSTPDRAPIDRWAVRVLCASSGAEARKWGE